MATKKSTIKKTDTNLDTVSMVQDIVSKLLELMGTQAKATVREDMENDAFIVDIESESETGLLIGSRGDTLMALQTIVAMILKN